MIKRECFRGPYFMGPQVSIEYLYTLEEIFYDTSDNVDSIPSLKLYENIVHAFGATEYWTAKTGIGYKLWEYIYLTNRDHICVITDKEVFDKEETRDFWANFFKIWWNTHIYYEKMISLLESRENQLLDKVVTSSESESRFNDTPDTSGTHDTSDYTSNLTKGKNTISTDAGTVLERLEEVRRKYNDYYKLWAMEFDKLFVSELNYQSSKTLSEEY